MVRKPRMNPYTRMKNNILPNGSINAKVRIVNHEVSRFERRLSETFTAKGLGSLKVDGKIVSRNHIIVEWIKPLQDKMVKWCNWMLAPRGRPKSQLEFLKDVLFICDHISRIREKVDIAGLRMDWVKGEPFMNLVQLAVEMQAKEKKMDTPLPEQTFTNNGSGEIHQEVHSKRVLAGRKEFSEPHFTTPLSVVRSLHESDKKQTAKAIQLLPQFVETDIFAAEKWSVPPKRVRSEEEEDEDEELTKIAEGVSKTKLK